MCSRSTRAPLPIRPSRHARGVRRLLTNLRRGTPAEGIAAAKARGVYKGRKPKIDSAVVHKLRYEEKLGRPISRDGSALAGQASVVCLGRRGGIAMPIRPESPTTLSPRTARIEQPRPLRARRRKMPALWPAPARPPCCLPDGRWFDAQAATWRDRRGRLARWPRSCGGNSVPDDARRARDGAPGQRSTNNRLKNLRALCLRCHMLHDRPHHLAAAMDHLPAA